MVDFDSARNSKQVETSKEINPDGISPAVAV